MSPVVSPALDAGRAAPVAVLVAEDSKYDRMILQRAFDELGLNASLYFVGNGEDVLDYLNRRNAYVAASSSPRPVLVVMDLNMPRMNGQEALQAIRGDARLRVLPVIFLSTSSSQRQVAAAYANGANGFMTKPGPYDDLVELVRDFADFWLSAATLPDIRTW